METNKLSAIKFLNNTSKLGIELETETEAISNFDFLFTNNKSKGSEGSEEVNGKAVIDKRLKRQFSIHLKVNKTKPVFNRAHTKNRKIYFY